MASAWTRVHDNVKSARTVSEAVRGREALRYEPCLETDFRINDTARPFPSAHLATATDSVMTALAQVGVYQTGTERAFISLFDASYQYIVAEATPLTPLAPAIPSDNCPEPLIHCGTAVPRSHGVCEYALNLTEDSDSTQPAELPIKVVIDMRSDPTFSSRPFCRSDGSYQFYAAVPIRTRKGVDIGTYCVFGRTKPANWDDSCAQRLRDVSSAIMEHLVTKRLKHAYRRNERINRGLGSFIEGKTTLSWRQCGLQTVASTDDPGPSRTDAPIQHANQREPEEVTAHGVLDKTEYQAPAGTTSDASDDTPSNMRHQLPDAPHPLGPSQVLPPAKPPRSKSSHSDEAAETACPRMVDSDDNNTTQIFSRAANIIKESFEVSGCAFFDVTFGSYRAMAFEHSSGNTGRRESFTTSLATSSSDDDLLPTTTTESPDSPSDILGFSASHSSSPGRDELLGARQFITKRFLARLLRHHPNGMIYNFDAGGELQSSDFSEEDPTSDASASSAPSQGSTTRSSETAAPLGRRTRSRSGREAAIIKSAFPASRTVAFVPVWDSKRERWLAGGFMYSLAPTRVFSIEAELSILKVFCNMIAAKVHDIVAQQVDKAKSDTLGSLSHELRTPLHGIVFSTELLNDTKLSVFQTDATHTIETCCRTLLDTIDHLLDFSKVGSFTSKHQRDSRSSSPKLRKRDEKTRHGKTALHAHVQLDGLLEEVTNSMFAGFNFQYMSIRQLSKDKSLWTDTAAHNHLDGMLAREQLDISIDSPGIHKLHFRDVSVCMSIDPACDWMFHVQVGAIRRIIMNLFGNSLKYTEAGFIHVRLEQEMILSGVNRPERMVKLVVQDTGKGIGEDYLTHKLFKPFSQEDELSAGTGLGLSVVKGIVSRLHGHIQVDSQAAVGTTITVKLPLAQSSQLPGSIEVPHDDDYVSLNKNIRELQGMRVRIIGMGQPAEGSAFDSRRAVEDICRHWLRLDILTEDQTHHMAPDVVLWLDNALQASNILPEKLAKAPNIVICRDPFVAYSRVRLDESTGQEGIFEYITQPIGPRKLAKSMQLAYQRWMGLPKFSPLRRPLPLRSRSSQGAGARSEDTMDKPRPLSAGDGVSSGSILPSQWELTNQSQPYQPMQPQPDEKTALSGVPEPVQQPVVKKILLVDDNYINLKVLIAYMGKLGQGYDTATNGQEAVDAYTLDPDQFVGILMDISMPVMDGLEATRAIRAFERQNRRTPAAIFALTGLVTNAAQEEALDSGVDVFLTKPVRLKVLQEVLESRQVLCGAPNESPN